MSASDIIAGMASGRGLDALDQRQQGQRNGHQTQPVVTRKDDNGIAVGGYVLTPKGLVVNDGATEADWNAVGAHLQAAEKALNWMVADWVAFGTIRYQQSYESIAAMLGRWSAKTLTNWASVAQNIEVSRRRDTLTFSHHVPVAKLSSEYQDYWLNAAEYFHWSSRELEHHMAIYPHGLPDGFTFSRRKALTGSGAVSRFAGAVEGFERRAMKVASKADKEERKEMAKQLRELAARIERAK